MKKSIIIVTVSILIIGISHTLFAGVNCCQCTWKVEDTPIYASNCTKELFCNGCSGTITSTIVNGVCTPTCTPGSGGGGTITPKLCQQNQYKSENTCIDCPEGGTTDSLGGGSVITDCYLPKGTTRSDETGTYTYTDKCQYSKFIIPIQ